MHGFILAKEAEFLPKFNLKIKVLIIVVAIFIVSIIVKSIQPNKSNALTVARPIIVDHNSVALFDQIPEEYISRARELRMIFLDRSVGANINQGLDCLAYPSISAAPNYCKRPNLTASELKADAKYDRRNWAYQFITLPNKACGTWQEKIDCFIEIIRPIINNYDVLSYQNSYLEVNNGSTIDDIPGGYFYNNPNYSDIYDLERFQNQYPDKVFIYWTSSLARSIGTVEAESFNNQMRAYTRANNKILFDVADIESHDPQGNPCFDNRDGVSYCANATNCENHPDDGLNIPAICPAYTTETEGGHLGSHSTGMIRIAKAYWVLMAQIAGWNPESTGNSNPSNNQPPLVNAGADQTVNNAQIILQGNVTDDGLIYNTPLISWSQISGPAQAIISAINAITTSVQLPVNGIYSFRLTANDGELQSTDDVTITYLTNVGPTLSLSPTTSVTSPPTSGQTSPVAKWSFDQPNSVNEDIWGCNTCRNFNAIWTPDGKTGGAFQFDGQNSYIDLNGFNYLDNAYQFTLAVWIKPAFDETSSSWGYVFSSYNSRLFYLGSNRKFRFTFRTPTGEIFIDSQNLYWDPDSWHLLTITYDSANVKMYWDKNLITSKTATGNIVSNTTSPTYLGASTVRNYVFAGIIDEFVIYNRALSIEEINQL